MQHTRFDLVWIVYQKSGSPTFIYLLCICCNSKTTGLLSPITPTMYILFRWGCCWWMWRFVWGISWKDKQNHWRNLWRSLCGCWNSWVHQNHKWVSCCKWVFRVYYIHCIYRADLDPIYYCELLDQCKYNDNGDATITNATVTPKSGPQGLNWCTTHLYMYITGHFKFPMTYVSKNGTSTGEVGIFIDTADGIPVEDVQLNMPQVPGTYNVEWNLKAEPNPNCDPSQGPCENWLPGLYNATIGEFFLLHT